MILGELYNNPPTDRTAPAILKKPFEEKKITKNRAFIYETPPALDSLIDATFAHLQNTIDLKHYLRRSLPDYPIQLMCLMGTPIDTARFDINMNIVKQAINLYSPADFIQAIVGKQLLPEHERRANLQTKIHHQACSTNPIDPCHKHIRNPIIGKWLLHLPKIIAEKESATTITGGTAIFYNDKEPVFMPGVYSVLDESSNSPEESETDSAEDSDADSDDATSFSIE